MINTVRAWAIGLCFAAVACAVLELLNPNGTLRKPMRLLIGLFFLCVLIFPSIELTQNAENFLEGISANEDEPSTEGLQGTLEEQSKQAAEQALRQFIYQRFEQEKIVIQSMEVETILEENEVQIHAVLVSVPKSETARAEMLLQAMGLPYRVQAVEEANTE